MTSPVDLWSASFVASFKKEH